MYRWPKGNDKFLLVVTYPEEVRRLVWFIMFSNQTPEIGPNVLEHIRNQHCQCSLSHEMTDY